MVQAVGLKTSLKRMKEGKRERKYEIMAGTMDILIREMTIADYDQVYGLWTEIKGFGIRSIDDSREAWSALGGIPLPVWWLSRTVIL